jgi:hypothetical protein
MRRDQNVRRRPEGIVLWKRFRISYIKCSATNLLLLERFDESFLVDDLATSYVRNESASWIALLQKLKLISGE